MTVLVSTRKWSATLAPEKSVNMTLIMYDSGGAYSLDNPKDGVLHIFPSILGIDSRFNACLDVFRKRLLGVVLLGPKKTQSWHATVL